MINASTGITLEPLTSQYSVYVSDSHRFSTDTLLLAEFSMPHQKETCADFGTGCGVIPLLWCARSAPKQIYALDLHPEAVQLTQGSVLYNRLTEQIQVVQGDLRQIQQDVRFRELHLIACNPPYKPAGTGICSASEADALARHETQCTIEDVTKAAAKALRFGGRLCVCHRPERLCDVLSAFRQNGIEPKRLQFVQQNREKAPFLFLLEGRRGAKPFLQVLPAFFVMEKENYSPGMRRVYGDYKQCGASQRPEGRKP